MTKTLVIVAGAVSILWLLGEPCLYRLCPMSSISKGTSGSHADNVEQMVFCADMHASILSGTKMCKLPTVSPILAKTCVGDSFSQKTDM